LSFALKFFFSCISL